MSHEIVLLILLTATLLFSLVSKWVQTTIVTMPIVYTALGYIVYLSLGNHSDAEALRSLAKTVAEITLILVLFADASHVRFKLLVNNYQIPLRMLLIGMPLTILLGTLVVLWLNPGAGLAVSLLVAAILTPTDAALGQSVVSSDDVPNHLAQSINVESGLNDGLALPVVLVAASLAVTMAAPEQSENNMVVFTLMQIILGPIAGIVVGWCTAKLLDIAEERDTISMSFEGIFFLVCAFLAFFAAEAIGGNGFIAAFVGGMVFGNVHKRQVHFIGEFMEGQGQMMTMAAFFIFGVVLVPQGLEHANVRTLTLAVLFLTAIRMIPIFISLTGLGLRVRDKLFLGWFGPRGLASILFALLVVEEYDVPGKEAMLSCVVLTVLLSIVLHGITSTPLAQRIGK